MEPRALGAAITAALALGGLSAVAAAQPERPAARPTLMPRSTDPLRLGGDGFKRRERVRVTVTPSSGEGTSRRVRARRDGSFSVTFAGVEACNGFDAVAVGRRGSRASVQFSALLCP